MLQILFIFPVLGIILLGGFLIFKIRAFGSKFKEKEILLKRREEEMRRKMYELAILKELGDRIGYSLNIQEIIDIITGSLKQFIDYSAVSYMLIEPEKIIFKMHLEKSVHRKFVDEIKDRMLKSLSALLNKELAKNQIEELLSGAILIEEAEEPMRSFFNIPLVIGGRVQGVLTVAHTAAGLYKEEEMTILYKIVSQASRAVTKLQEVVETEEKKLNAMVESMSEGVVMTDTDYRIIVANPAIKNAVGIENINEPVIFDFIDRLEGKFDLRGKLEESVKLNKILESPEILINNKFYQIFVYPVKAKTIFENKSETLGAVAIFHDITRKKELDKLRDDFTSMMVHELRSPLDGIKKMTELMQKSDAERDPKMFSDYPIMINKSSAHMLELVNSLLDAAKIESGKFKVIPEKIDIKKLISEKADFFAAAAKNSNIGLKTVFDKNIPENISADPFRIGQILNNFISNAIKFTKPGGEIFIQTLAHKKGVSIQNEADAAGVNWMIKNKNLNSVEISNSVIIAVTDTGIGISKENIKKLFNKFEQLQASSEDKSQKGTGLGLVVAKGIAEAHRGTVGVESEEGKGSTFYFTLPI